MEKSSFVMSLARLYGKKQITDTKVDELFADKKITAEEVEFIKKGV